MRIYGGNTTTKASFAKTYDADGKVWIEAIAHDALVANTPYQVYVNEYGQVTAALADAANNAYIGVPNKAWASGDLAKLQIGGDVDDMITPSITGVVGYALRIYDGAVALVSADYSGLAGQFAAIRTASTTSTTQDVCLIPERILGVT